MAQRNGQDEMGGFVKSRGDKKPKSLKLEEKLGKRFKKDKRPRRQEG